MSVRRVLVTGVYGLIAGAIYQRLDAQPERYAACGLARRRQASERVAGDRSLEVPEERFFLADLSDYEALVAAMRGVDTVVQMAADPRHDGPWESILASNVVGVRNVFEAARCSGVRRVIYASSVMVSWGYQQDEPYRAIAECRFDDVDLASLRIVSHEWPSRPTDLYSSSKVWGEALGRYYAEVHGLSVVCLRIGWVNAVDTPAAQPGMSGVWCSQRDVVQMVVRAIEAPDDLRFDVFYAVSDNRFRWVDTDHARERIGYVPRDSAEETTSRR